MEKSSPLTPKSQPRWGHYPILPSPITRGNAASTNTLTASSGSTSQKVPTSLFCPMPMSKGSRTNSTLAPERYSATKPLARFSSAPEIRPLHFTVEWASFKRQALSVAPAQGRNWHTFAGLSRAERGSSAQVFQTSNFLSNLDRVVDLDPEIADGALDLGVTEQS